MLFKIVDKARNNDLIRGSFVLFTGSMAGNVLAYLYNLVVGRMLGPQNYGVFSSLLSIVYIISVFSATLSLLVAKFSAEYNSKSDSAAIYSFFRYTTKRFFIIGFLLFFILVAAAPLIGNFLKIDSVAPIIILSSSLVFSFLVAINRGILQGMLKFFSLSVNSNMEMALRIAISILFIYWGWGVNGALTGLTLGVLAGYVLSFLPLRNIFKDKIIKSIDITLIKNYAIPLFVSFLGMTLLYTVDILLVKHYLSDHEAGIYSALSTFGKIVFFSSSAISIALFPMAAERNAQGKRHGHLLRDAVIIVILSSVAILSFYFLVPTWVIKLFLGDDFIEASPYLGLFGIIMMFYSIINILINYYLSINKTSVAYLPFAFSLALVILMVFFHDSIQQIIYIRIIHIAILLIVIPISHILILKNYKKAYVGA